MLHEISFKALPAALVEKVEVDVGELKVGDTIRVCDLPIAQDKDVDLMTDAEATVVTITEVHVSAADAARKQMRKLLNRINTGFKRRVIYPVLNISLNN